MSKLSIPSLAVAELSTAHMSPKDNDYLRKLSEADRQYFKQCIGRVIAHEYGFFVSLSYNVDVLSTQAAWSRALRKIGFSATFAKTCRECKKAGFQWVYFDRDADTVDGLPTESW